MIKVPTKDGSFTLKSEKFNECYHSSEGALTETLYKHILPGFEAVKKSEIKILDICFGLGFNTFAAVLHRPLDSKLKIVSPEIDLDLIKSLKKFQYPDEFNSIRNIIDEVIENLYYKNENIEIIVKIGDAKELIKNLDDKIDLVYQDAFSPKVNKELWTIDYFQNIKKNLNKDGIITTYSVSTPVRCALYKLGFNLYTHSSDKIRKGTIASLRDDLSFERVNFEEKLKRVDCYFLSEN